ncbi:MAG: hypothetical protein K9N23_17810 [Akkermansiaceae bacterium]|nr:hypothetical protein [Akkermansiaceae bacterium]MCF7733550.1 hypothetical protein [Akkermansiaceae bacterium]
MTNPLGFGCLRLKPVPTESAGPGFDLLAESGTDAREPIAQLVAQYGWPLRSLFRHDATLEDVFVELTRRD